MRPIKRDPAPSRVTYRLQRLWLRPNVRRAVKTGPMVAVLIAGVTYLATSENIREQVISTWTSAEAFINGRDEFRVAGLVVTGASPALESQIVGMTGGHLPASSLRLDLKAIRDRIEEIPAIERASARIAPGGALNIDVIERRPVALLRDPDGLFILDREGVTLGQIANRAMRVDLPLLSGQGAKEHVEEAQAIISGAATIYKRVRGLERIGGRRWNLVLDRDQIVMLPEFGALDALRRVMAYQDENQLLDRDVVAVDMRDPVRPALRLGKYALADRGNFPMPTQNNNNN